MPEPSTRPVVLLVEDNPSMRALIRSLVEGVSSAVYECADGESALELYGRVHPGCVLMDVKMAGMDGIAATRALLKSDPHARVIIVTEQQGERYRRAAAAAGAAGFVRKDQLLDLPPLVSASPEPRAEGRA